MAKAHIENDAAFSTSGLPHQGQITSGRLRAMAGAQPYCAESLGLLVDWLALSRERLILDLDKRTFLRCEGLSRGQVGAFAEFGHIQIYWNRDLRMPGWQIELVWRDTAIRACRVLERSFGCGNMDAGHRWARAWAEALADRLGVDVRDDPGASEYLPGPDATLAALTARACESAPSHDPRTLPLLRQALDPGETVLWAGPPDPWSRAESKSVAFLGRCIALLAVPSLVSLIFWEESPLGCVTGTACQRASSYFAGSRQAGSANGRGTRPGIQRRDAGDVDETHVRTHAHPDGLRPGRAAGAGDEDTSGGEVTTGRCTSGQGVAG